MKKYFTILSLFVFAFLQRTAANPNSFVLLRGYLYSVATDGSSTLLDGDLTQYDPSYSDSLDALDSRKMNNPGENIGMLRDGSVLAIERRQTIIHDDTVFYKVWNLRSGINYQLSVISSNLFQPGLIGYVSDAYLNTITPIDLNGTTPVDFAINSSPASYSANRFTLIFTTSLGGTLPITFSSLKAFENNNTVNVQWNTSNESHLKQYNVERSADGKSFASIGQVAAKNVTLGSYNYSDNYPTPGYNYYRIQSVSTDGSIKYSSVTGVLVQNGYAVMKVFPNPVNGNIIHLQMINKPQGEYMVSLVDNAGRVLFSKKLEHNTAQTENLNVEANISHGIYSLEVRDPSGTRSSINLYY